MMRSEEFKAAFTLGPMPAASPARHYSINDPGFNSKKFCLKFHCGAFLRITNLRDAGIRRKELKCCTV